MPRDLRIGILIHDLNTWGGQDRSMLEIARGLSRRAEVDLHSFTLDDPGFPAEWGRARFRPVRPLLRRPLLLKILLYYAALSFRARGRGVSMCVGACALRSEFVQVQFVHAAWNAHPGSRKPLRPTVGSLYAAFMRRFNSVTERLLFSPRRRYVAIAECVKRELIGHFGLPADRIDVIHHGVDPEVFRPARGAELGEREGLRASMGVRPGEVLVLFVGAYERKGLEASIRALSLLGPAERAGMRLVALGNGDRPRFEELARGLGVADRVVLHGFSKEVQRYYRAADAFLLPTLYEPFGLVILEAMATGLACVVSARAGASELIRDGENGWLLQDPSSPREIADRLGRLLADPAARRALSARARATAESQDWDRVSQRYWEVLSR